MNRAYRKTVIRMIGRSMGRWLAILAIIALGVGFFSGLKLTRPAMIETANRYVTEHRMFDVRALSTIGFTAEEAEKIADLPGVETAAGTVSEDAVFTDGDAFTGVLRVHSLTEGVNEPDLVTGRLPVAGHEVLLDAAAFGEGMIGREVRLAEDNPDQTKESFAHDRYEVTGLARSPYYLNTERGTTTLGNGKVAGFAFVPETGFAFEYYEELMIAMAHDEEIYSEGYRQKADAWKKDLKAWIGALVGERYVRELANARRDIADAKAELAEKTAEAEAALAEAKARLDEALADIERGEGQLADARAELDDREAELAERESDLRDLLDQAERLPDPALAARMILQLEAGLAEIEAGRLQLQAGRAELDDREAELADARRQWEEGMAEYEQGLRDLAREKEEAEADIRAAEEALEAFKAPDVFALGRDTNTGYVSFENDAETVDGIATVFPVFFFLIAALVCSTTMTRMVDDERTQIGTLRALGYGNGAIMAKYMVYSGSAAVIGAVAGYALGIWLFPVTIWQAYAIMYGFADLIVVSDARLFALSLAAALVCSVGTTYAAGRNELRHMPAELIRPKAPPAGKRILLERIGFVWRRMKFLHKVSARNIFRFKKRMIMMILGIAGCTALVLTGYGLRDSIVHIVDFQFDEIMLHDASVTFTEPIREDELEAALAGQAGAVERHAVLLETSVDFLIGERGKTVYLIATDDPGFGDFVDLHLGEEHVPYPQSGEVAISEKLADMAGVKIGDTVSFRYGGETTAELVVSGIFENYVFHYAYVSADTFEQAFGEKYEPKTLYVITAEGADDYAVAAELAQMDDAAGVNVVQDTRTMVGNTMNRMNDIVLLVIACAGALAFIVLFNLTNINISERVREIATLKVLGFFPNETRAYVFRENMVLSAMGILFGLPLGVLLHRYVMNQINIDIVSFDITIVPASYLYTVLTVLAFTMAVNLLMGGKIERISMAESLKSME